MRSTRRCSVAGSSTWSCDKVFRLNSSVSIDRYPIEAMTFRLFNRQSLPLVEAKRHRICDRQATRVGRQPGIHLFLLYYEMNFVTNYISSNARSQSHNLFASFFGAKSHRINSQLVPKSIMTLDSEHQTLHFECKTLQKIQMRVYLTDGKHFWHFWYYTCMYVYVMLIVHLLCCAFRSGCAGKSISQAHSDGIDRASSSIRRSSWP